MQVYGVFCTCILRTKIQLITAKICKNNVNALVLSIFIVRPVLYIKLNLNNIRQLRNVQFHYIYTPILFFLHSYNSINLAEINVETFHYAQLMSNVLLSIKEMLLS